MAQFTRDYDPGFLNVPGFGQNITNPLAAVYYDSLGVVKDLSVYQSIYAAKDLNAGLSLNVGESRLSTDGFLCGVSATFMDDVEIQNSLVVLDTTYTTRLFVGDQEFAPRRVEGKNGSFVVLAAI